MQTLCSSTSVGGENRGVGANCGFHPLIHTSPGFAQPQDVENKKAEPKTPHFLGLNQDIVAWS
jgi:hypothetical protein